MGKTKVFVSKNSELKFTGKGASAEIVEVDQDKFRRPMDDLDELKKEMGK